MSSTVNCKLAGISESSAIASNVNVPGTGVIQVTLADGVIINVPEMPPTGGQLNIIPDLINTIIVATAPTNVVSNCPAVLQVNTATLAGTITPNVWHIKVTVTAAGMSNSPKDVIVAVAGSDNASAIAGKVRTALGLDADVGAFFTVGGTGATAVLTAKTAAANDATMNIASADYLATGLTPAASSANTTGGVASVLQQETATIVGTIGAGGAGNATIVVTAAGMPNSPKTVSVAVANNDTATQVAGKVRTALTADTDIGGFFTISGSGPDIVATVKTAAANDGTLNISSDNGSCSGLTTEASSANTTAGVLGVLQIETATLAGTITAAGDVKITVTAAGMTNSPKIIGVSVANSDTASQVAGKIRTALTADTDVAAFFTVGGSTTAVALTAKAKAANDGTMNIASDNGAASGLTVAATSAAGAAGRTAGANAVTPP